MNKSSLQEQKISSQMLYSVKDVQKILAIGRTQAYSLISSKAIASIRIGRSVRVRHDDLARYIEANRNN